MGRGAASLPVQRVRVGDGQGGRRDTVRVQPGRAWRKGRFWLASADPLPTRGNAATGPRKGGVKGDCVNTLPGGRAPPSCWFSLFSPLQKSNCIASAEQGEGYSLKGTEGKEHPRIRTAPPPFQSGVGGWGGDTQTAVCTPSSLSTSYPKFIFFFISHDRNMMSCFLLLITLANTITANLQKCFLGVSGPNGLLPQALHAHCPQVTITAWQHHPPPG